MQLADRYMFGTKCLRLRAILVLANFLAFRDTLPLASLRKPDDNNNEKAGNSEGQQSLLLQRQPMEQPPQETEQEQQQEQEPETFNKTF